MFPEEDTSDPPMNMAITKMGKKRRGDHQWSKKNKDISEVQQKQIQLDFENLVLQLKPNGIEQLISIQNLYQETIQNIDQVQESIPIMEENDYGDSEYKLKLIDQSVSRLSHLITQMKFRLKEGSGEANYYIGYEDSGLNLGLNEQDFKSTLGILCHMVRELNIEMVVEQILKAREGLVAKIKIRKFLIDQVQLELKIMILGTRKSGKTTLIGVLLNNKLDDGKGSARLKVLNHKHEVMTGVTSSLTYTAMAIDEYDEIIPSQIFHKKLIQDQNCFKVISFLDCGSIDKYSQQFIHGYLISRPYYQIITISIHDTIEQIKEVINIIYALQKNFSLVITHVEDPSSEQLIKCMSYVKQQALRYFLQSEFKNEQDIVMFSSNYDPFLVPVFLISNVTGNGLNRFKRFIKMIPLESYQNDPLNEEAEFIIQNKYLIEENKIIVCGWVYSSQVTKGQQLYLGPFEYLGFMEIQCFKIPVRSVQVGQSCSMLIQLPKDQDDEKIFSQIKKGMLMISSNQVPVLRQRFIAKIQLCNKNQVTFGNQYEPLLISDTFKQHCRLISYSHFKKAQRKKRSSKSKDEKIIKDNPQNRCESVIPQSNEFRIDKHEITLQRNQQKKFLIEFKIKSQYL